MNFSHPKIKLEHDNEDCRSKTYNFQIKQEEDLYADEYNFSTQKHPNPLYNSKTDGTDCVLSQSSTSNKTDSKDEEFEFVEIKIEVEEDFVDPNSGKITAYIDIPSHTNDNDQSNTETKSCDPTEEEEEQDNVVTPTASEEVEKLSKNDKMKQGKSPRKRVHCNLCSRSFSCTRTLKSHKFRIHTNKGEKPFQCDRCGKNFAISKYLKKHECKERDKSFKCNWEDCQLFFNEFCDLETHLKDIHAGAKPHQCGSCEKSFMTKSGLFTHRQSHEEGYKCPDCGKVLATKESLKRHLMCHHEKRFSCTKCGKGFTTNAALALHDNSIHKKIETFKCDICGKGYFRRSEYINHMNSHNDVKPLQCEECGKRFQHNRDLKRHCDSHKGLKPFKCDICGRCFPNTRNLRRHCKALHKDIDATKIDKDVSQSGASK